MSEGAAPVERSIFIEAEPETVFPFLVDAGLMAEWFGISHVLEVKVGGTFQVEVSRSNIAVGVFTEVISNRRVAFTWGWDSADAALKPGTSPLKSTLSRRRGERFCGLYTGDFPRISITYTQNAGSYTWAGSLHAL